MVLATRLACTKAKGLVRVPRRIEVISSGDLFFEVELAAGPVVDINGTFTQTYDDYMSGIGYGSSICLIRAVGVMKSMQFVNVDE
jgi:hypothetical protein